MRCFLTLLLRYALATVGLFFVALGIALSVKSNLGTTPLSAPACVIAAAGSLTVGGWTVIVNCSYILLQMAVLRRRFKIGYLMQIPATIVFGSLIDLCVLGLEWLTAVDMLGRLALSLLACLATALGVSLEVAAKGWMLSAELTVWAFADTFHKPFHTLKVTMDCLMLVLAAVLSLILFSNPFGPGAFQGLGAVLTGSGGGVLIGLGTVLLAFLAGAFMKFTDPLVDRLMKRLPQ